MQLSKTKKKMCKAPRELIHMYFSNNNNNNKKIAGDRLAELCGDAEGRWFSTSREPGDFCTRLGTAPTLQGWRAALLCVLLRVTFCETFLESLST